MPGKLGRKKPLAQFDYGHFRAVVASDGKTRYYPRIAKHYNLAKDTQPPPAGPLGRLEKAKAAIARMYRNDALGCCVISSRKHKIGVLTGNDGAAPLVCTDAEVDADYVAACGGGDNGCDMSAVNDYEKSTGMMMSGVRHVTDGSVVVDNTNKMLVQVVLDLFGTINVGMSLPDEWYQSADGADWGPTNTGIVGGHEVQAFDYDAQGVWIATWGGTRRILWAAFCARTWIDECYTSLAKDWYGSDNLAPNGIDAATLAADLQIAASGQVPPLPGPTPPPVPPTPPPMQQYVAQVAPIAAVPFSLRLFGVIPVSGTIGPIAGQNAPVVPAMGRRAPSGFFGWLKFIGDVGKLALDAVTGNVGTLITDVQQLVADWNEPPLPPAWVAAGLPAGLLTDIAQLFADVRAGNFAAVLTDLLKIAADLGLVS